jgi:RHS repeat-associated protein
VVHLGQTPVSLLDAAGREHALVWDVRGDLRLALGPAGVESERPEFDPYGRETSLAGVDRMPFGFGGRGRSGPTSDFGVRSYDPATGRFLEPDPALLGPPPETILADPRQLGGYLYASENPIVGTDRRGLETYFVNGINYNAEKNPYGETFTAALEARGVEGVHFVEAFEEGGILRDVAEAGREMFLSGGEHRQLAARVRRDVAAGALSEGEPLNLVGYSAGGAVVANAALQLLRAGIPVATVVVIGSPVSGRKLADLRSLGVRVSIVRNPGDYVGVQSLVGMVLHGLSHASREAHREYDWDTVARHISRYLDPWNAEHRDPPVRRGE